ncbi:MAG: PEP-CTERM sorting domain-containing protein, partial [Burkholderiales bacterium]|nr:PEP-CTERM sorting domain-containing protein [Burkholderiales bacterium]
TAMLTSFMRVSFSKRKIPKTYLRILAGAAALAYVTSSHASLILLAPQDFQGTGLGAVNTILTIQSPGSSSTESGGVSFNGTTDATTGDAKTGASQTQTRTLAELGITSAQNLRIVFNALEPGGTGSSIQLSNLVLTIYSSSGATLFSSGAFTPILFPDTFTGAGNSGFVFGLDATQALAAQTAGFGSTSNRIGLSATANLATGGFETFFVANKPAGVVVQAIPEPTTALLLGLGLLGFSWRRQK